MVDMPRYKAFLLYRQSKANSNISMGVEVYISGTEQVQFEINELGFIFFNKVSHAIM